MDGIDISDIVSF